MALRAVPDHPKFAQFQASLDLTRFAALGLLEAVWHFTARFTPQGNIGKYDDAAIAAWVGWSAADGDLIAALVDAHWLDRHDDYRLVVHDWDQYADAVVHTTLARELRLFANGAVPQCGRLNQRERARYHEWLADAGLEAQAPGRPPEKQPKSSHNAAINQTASAKKPKPEPVPEPEPEPGRKTTTCAAASAPQEQRVPEPAALWEGRPLTLQTVSGEAWPVPAAACLEWASAYPGVDVLEELLRMRAWLTANPKNRKTAAGMRRFAVNWLARAQDRSRPAGGSGNAYGNRGQHRTDGNLNALRRALADECDEGADSSGGSAPGEHQRRDAAPVLAGDAALPPRGCARGNPHAGHAPPGGW